MGYPEGRPRGAEAVLWDNLRKLLGPELLVRLSGLDLAPEEVVHRTLAHSFFLRLPRWTDPARAAFRRLQEQVSVEEPDLWLRRFISDLAGLEGTLGQGINSLLASARLKENYEALLKNPPKEKPHETLPVMVREGVPSGPLGTWEEEAAWAVFEETGAEPETRLARTLGATAERLLRPLEGAPPEVVRSALLDLVHFEGVPRVPPHKRGVLGTLSEENLGLLLSL